MSCACCGASSGEEMDTILQFAEEPIKTELMVPKRDGTETCERSHAAHTSVDIDPTTKRLDKGNDPKRNQGRDQLKNVNEVEASRKGNEPNGLQRIENNASVVTLECSTTVDSKRSDVRLNCSSCSSTEEYKCSTTISGQTAGTCTSCEEVAERINGPVVAKVHRKRDGRSPCCRTCSYFCKMTGIMKIIELISMMLALIVTVAVDGARYYSDSLIIVNGVMLMGLTVTPTLVLCYLLKQTQIQRTIFECIINGFLALYSVVAGCLALGPLMGSGSNVAVSVMLVLFLIIAGVAYAVDCVLAILKYRTF